MRKIFARCVVIASLLAPALVLVAWMVSHVRAIEEWHSRPRYCMALRIEAGVVLVYYDGAADVRTFTPQTLDYWQIHYDSTSPSFGGGWQYARLTFPIWMPFVLSCIPAVSIFISRPIARSVRIRRRRRRGLCVGCGYNLRGNTSGICPECGRSTRPEGECSGAAVGGKGPE